MLAKLKEEERTELKQMGLDYLSAQEPEHKQRIAQEIAHYWTDHAEATPSILDVCAELHEQLLQLAHQELNSSEKQLNSVFTGEEQEKLLQLLSSQEKERIYFIWFGGRPPPYEKSPHPLKGEEKESFELRLSFLNKRHQVQYELSMCELMVAAQGATC